MACIICVLQVTNILVSSNRHIILPATCKLLFQCTTISDQLLLQLAMRFISNIINQKKYKFHKNKKIKKQKPTIKLSEITVRVNHRIFDHKFAHVLIDFEKLLIN